MESQAQYHNTPVPPYEQWPSVPKGSLGNPSSTDQRTATVVDDTTSNDYQDIRATSTPSMDDIEAAQALEGLRAGYQTPDDCKPVVILSDSL